MLRIVLVACTAICLGLAGCVASGSIKVKCDCCHECKECKCCPACPCGGQKAH